MQIFGLSITRTKQVPASLSSVNSRGGWWPIVREPFAGAWQRNIEYRTEDVLTFAAVYACVTLIASDIAKLRIKLVSQDDNGIWTETQNPAFSPVLRKPNRYQTRIKFVEQWLTSKLIHGNTYVLKQRDNRRVVTALYVLDPTRVRAMVAEDGAVFYALQRDNLAQADDVIVPASEIIHDVMVALYHPLCGVSPISACGLAAVQGLKIQNHSTNFFANGSHPGGILTAPGSIDEEDRKQMEAAWESNYGGLNAGKVAVLGNGLKYEQMAVNATDAQLIEQLKWTAENVCSAFHVPAYMVGVGSPPAYNNIEALNQQYYSQCLQTHIESLELLLDEGLGLAVDGQPQKLGTEFDLDELLRMDTASRVKAAADAVGSGVVSPNEARKQYHGLGPVAGGGTPYMQQQNWPLQQLAQRETPRLEPAAQIAAPTEDDPAEMERECIDMFRKELAWMQAA